MMKNFKKLYVLSLCLFGLAIQAQNCGDVILDSPCHRFQVEFNALFLKPTSSNLSFAAQVIPLPLPSPSWNIYDIQTKYRFGFDLGFRFIFDNSCTNLFVNWERFRSGDCCAIEVPSSDMVGPFFAIGPDSSPYKKAQGNVCFNLDKIDVNFGQYVYFGDCLKTNCFGGVSFIQIRQCLTSLYSNADDTVARTIITPSKFTGAGPQFGVDASYAFYCDLNLVGRAAVALYAGRLHNRTNFASVTPILEIIDFTSPNTQSICVQDRSQVIPAIEESIGLAWQHYFCNDAYLFRFDVGYQAQVFFNAIQTIDIGSGVVTPPVIDNTVGVYARTFQRKLSNFMLAGPYVSLVLGF